MNRSLGSATAAERVDRSGYAACDAFDAATVERLREEFSRLGVDRSIGFFATHAHLSPDRRRPVDELLRQLAAPVIESLFPGHVPFAAAFLGKPAGTGSPLPFHQDLTYTDERVRRSYVMWIPLVDTTDTGVLRVVEGSHRWADGIRPGGPNGMPTEPFQAELRELSVPVPVGAGTAIVWDSATIHGSDGNRSSSDRPVVSVAFASPEPLVYFHRGNDGAVEGFEIDREFFFGDKPFVLRPSGPATVEPWAAPVEPADLASHVQDAGAAAGERAG